MRGGANMAAILIVFLAFTAVYFVLLFLGLILWALGLFFMFPILFMIYIPTGVVIVITVMIACLIPTRRYKGKDK